jgi:glutamate synthase domain-containing protein 3
MVAEFSAVNAALRFQIDNCLRHAERFMESPRVVIMEARRNGGSPAGMIGAVAYGLETINPQLASQLDIIAAEIEGIATTDTAEKGWPYRAEGIADWTHNLRTMIEAIRADLDHPTARPV